MSICKRILILLGGLLVLAGCTRFLTVQPQGEVIPSSDEEFAALIKEYGEDPGMTDEARLQTGYQVHKDSVVYDPAFTAGAFSEKIFSLDGRVYHPELNRD